MADLLGSLLTVGACLRRGRRTGVDVVTSTLRSALAFGFYGRWTLAGPGCHPVVAGMRTSTLCLVRGRLGGNSAEGDSLQLGRLHRWAASRQRDSDYFTLRYTLLIPNFCCLCHQSSSMICGRVLRACERIKIERRVVDIFKKESRNLDVKDGVS